ncbi:HlyD family efflux transporter periplasmic adaptor subunit [Marinobacter fonticola]|uniref:HlyD family efflux transporter periplasmic adaptor subunit n=1 Tax=Marinobacter fonticola TaxID=2603215 RepID=UPI0011E81B20|nr:HlyD family efflux transporter periplasmic adaptor subunit [Marinobacter fonticola]
MVSIFDTAPRRSRALLWLCLIVLASFVTWASWAELDEVTRGEGRIIPSGRLQHIQSLEGGIVERLYVREGDRVEPGELLVKLRDTRFRSSFLETREQIRHLQASIARLDAEVMGAENISFPPETDLSEALKGAERDLFEARRDKLNEKIHTLKNQQRLAEKQLALLQPLVEKKAVSEMEYIGVQKEVASLKGDILDLSRAYSQESYTELAKKKGELARLEQVLLQRQDQLRRTEIVSPVRGEVNNIAVTTQGGVIQPGEIILDIIPTDDHLLVETRIKPQDVAFLAPGMRAIVKLTAYDYTLYGALDGEVLKISADAMEEETPRGKELFYEVIVATEAESLQSASGALPLKPGMVADVEILNGKRSVLSYLLNPVLKARLN